MTKSAEIIKINKDEQREIVVQILNHVTQVLYFFFEEHEEDLDDDERMDEFISYIWEVAVLAMGSMNMKVLGKSTDGKFIVEMTPVDSVKKMLIEKSIGEEDDGYYEDNVVDEEPEEGDIIDLGEWEEIFTS